MEQINLRDPDRPVQAREIPGMPRDAAFRMFDMLVANRYAVSIKHIGGFYFIEVPVGLRGDPAYGKQAEIQTLSERAGYRCLQTGQTLRIVG